MGCLFGYYGPPAPGLLEKMGALLSHRCSRGLEQTTLSLDPDTQVAIGRGITAWSSARQVLSTDKRALAYGGVIFNRTAPDFERLLQNEARPDLDQLEGAFVLALATEDACYLARDHAGIKTVYWTIHDERLLFASEVKALFAAPGLARRLRPGALAEYLSFSFIPGRRTMFQGIEELQPGCILRFSQGRADVRRHFRFEQFEAMQSDADHIAAMRATLQASVENCCRVSRRTPGVFISGGIDSSAVLALTALQYQDDRIPTFSVFFGHHFPNENEFIQMMVKRYRTEHHLLEVRPREFLNELHDIVWYLDEPIGDPVTVPNFLMARAASKITDVILNGEGGDPCFGGPKNIPMLLTKLYGPPPGESRDNWLERSYLRAFERCFQDLEELLDPDLLRAAGGKEALIEFLEPYFQTETPRDFVNRLMSINIRLKGANLILVKVDKMASANGLLALPPLFSRQIIEQSMRCPPALKLYGSIEKHVLKRAVEDIVPSAIIERPKSGMMVPVRFWFQGEMRRYGLKLLAPRKLKQQSLFRPAYVQKLLNYESDGVRGLRHGLKLWMLVTFLLWYERMIEGRFD